MQNDESMTQEGLIGQFLKQEDEVCDPILVQI